LAADVAFMPGEPFFAEPEQNLGRLRLNFSHVAPERLHEGLRRLAKVVRDAQAAEAA
ncbi:PLP-dependent aminotransferase family protein, partial [Xanthomonas citri pv. citri]|nr:PLP-dependent aminotransferase family protein [Xanthomonas citri pv. citri]